MVKIKKKNIFKLIICFGFILVIIVIFYYAVNQTTDTEKEGPNVLLITIDALRPDHLGCYGYKRNTSPNIDNLGKEGVIFTQAITQGPASIPSMPSIMTSLYPSQHGVKGMFTNASLSVPTLAGVLKKNNYYTGAIIAHEMRRTGVLSGFDFTDSNFIYQANVITKKAVGWLNKNKDKRFFLWLHYFDPHAPYLPPYPYDELFLSEKFKKRGKEFLAKKYYWVTLPQRLPPPPSSNFPKSKEKGKIDLRKKGPPLPKPAPAGQKELAEKAQPKPAFVGQKQAGEIRQPIPLLTKQTLDNTLTEEDKEYYISQYDGAIKFTDDQIGILFTELKRLGLDERTLIILTADHGENLADYNKYFFHADSLNDVLLKVPLIIKGNKLPQNKITERQVQLIDIMPTIFDILGIRENIEIEGISLFPLILDKKGGFRDYAFSEVFGIINAKSIRTKNWKLIYNLDENRYELYNLTSDPQEQHNLVNSEKEKFKFLRAKLEKWIGGLRLKKPPLTKPLDEKTKQELRSLGYAQ